MRTVRVLAVLGAFLVVAPPAMAVPPDWTPSEQVAPPDTGTDDLALAAHSSGWMAAAWTGPAASVVAAVRPPGGPWGPPESIGAGVQGSTRPIDVAVDADGDVVVAWARDLIAPNEDIATRFRPAGGGWGVVQSATSGVDATALARGPVVLFEPSGAATLLYSLDTGPAAADDLVTRAITRNPATGAWGGTASLSAAGFNAAPKDAAIDAAGNITVVWSRATAGIESMRRSAGGSWPAQGSADSVSTSATVFSPRVAVDPAGRAVAVWEEGTSPAISIVAARRATLFGTFAAPQVIATGSSTQTRKSDPRVAMAADGTAVAVWRTATATPALESVQARAMLAGDVTWGAAQPLSAVGIDTGVPSVTGHDGGFVAVWPDEQVDAVRFATRPSGGPSGLAWTPGADLLSATGTPVFQPRVVAAPSGNAVAAWSRGANPGAVEAALRDLDDPVAGPLTVPAGAQVGEPVPMSVTASDAWSGVGSVRFDFGDLTGAIGSSSLHAWSQAGSFPVTATVTDRAGRQASATQSIAISAPPAGPPPPSGGGDPTAGSVACGNAITGNAKPNRLRGTSGGDRISGKGGNDRIRGRGGDDCLLGAGGADRLVGGPGTDTARGGPGPDRIAMRDRATDRISCGSGRDTVTADPTDTVARDCEVVRRR